MATFADTPPTGSDVMWFGDPPRVNRRVTSDRRTADSTSLGEISAGRDPGDRRHRDRRRHGSWAVRPRVSVVIPALNEADNLPRVLARLPEFADEVILVDGHSTDDTIAVARAVRPDIRVVTQNDRGKGNALACGFALCTGDIIVMLDADGSTDPAEIPLFIAKLLDGADLVKGSRYAEDGGSDDLTAVRRYGNALLTGTVNVLFHTRFTDLCYGYMAFWRRCLPQLAIDRPGFEVETLLTLRAARAGLCVAEVPSTERIRVSGESHLRPVHDGLRVLWTITEERFARDRAAQLAPPWAALTGDLACVAPADVGESVNASATQANRHVGSDRSEPRANTLVSLSGAPEGLGDPHGQSRVTLRGDELLVIVPSEADYVATRARVQTARARVVVLPTR
jgi:hypothetical protein